LIAVFICNTVLPLASGGSISIDLYMCLAIGDVVALICFTPYLYKYSKKQAAEGESSLLVTGRTLVQTLGSGAQDGGSSILLIASGSAFATVLSTTDGVAAIMNWATNLPLPTLVTFAIVIILLTFLNGSPGCMIIAAPIFLPIAAQAGISNEVLMRIAVFGQCVLDTLPINGAILLVMAQSGLSMKEGYPGVFKTTVLYMFIGTVLVTALALIAPGIW
jgi:H+/gluconate symporter-like permease